MKRKDISLLTLCACMLALATILSFIKIFELSFGGTVTLCSMVPILYLALNYPFRWVFITSTAYGLIQMMASFYPPPAGTFAAYAADVLLDYVIAFGVLGLAGVFSKPFKGTSGPIIGAALAIICRFLCHFLSGILVWKVYAPEGQPVFLYSLVYNGSYMSIELIISLTALLFINGFMRRRNNRT